MKPGHKKKKTTKTVTKSVKPLLVSQKLTNVELETKLILLVVIRILRSKQARLKIADGSRLQFRGTSVFA